MSAGAISSLALGYVDGLTANVSAIVSVSGELRALAHCQSVDPKPTGCELDDPSIDFTSNVTGKN